MGFDVLDERDRDHTLAWAPQTGPQEAYVNCPVFEVCYGGARGGGKTDGSLGDFLLHQNRYGKHARGLFIRRKLVDLEDAIERAREIYERVGARWREQKSYFRFPNGAILRMRYLERDKDAQNYQGHAYTRVYVEELTQFADPAPLDKLKGTLRSAAGVPCGYRATCNPGGPGHAWVKSRYIDAGAFSVVREAFENPFSGEALHLSRVFIPARLTDNPKLLESDPLYVAKLQQTGSAALVRAWLEGDWNIVDGAFFDCWRPSKHIIRPFSVPENWSRFRSFDWGSASPFSVGWWAVVPEPHPTERIILPRGALVRYREWYGAKKDATGVTVPNVGLKLSAEQVAEGIKSREADDLVTQGVADPSIGKEDGGPSIKERMARCKLYWRDADNKRVARKGAMGGWDQMRGRLLGLDPVERADGTMEPGTPMIYTFSTCVDSIRTVPVLPHDPLSTEDVDTAAEDHAADEWRYACMSRPWLPPIKSKPKTRDPWDYDEDAVDHGGDWKVS